ncbi:MAG: group 1 truncated hemoglobin [Gammaproteobacteria bacterium]
MYKHYHKRHGLLAPDAEMWQALDEGQLLRSILTDFYTQVYADAALSPFFTGVTIDRIIDKQYSFLRSIFTGEKCYFGDHPKNAHHWMVISDDLFDYRAALLENSMRKHNLPSHLIRRWQKIESVFRKVIVKDTPIPRKVGNQALPLDGYNPITLDVSSLCDCCGSEIPSGTDGYYHRRTGQLNCARCHQRTEQAFAIN